MRIVGLIFSLLLTDVAAARLQVFACEPEWAALSDAIGGEYVETFSATSADQDVHFIQARPSLIARLRRADLLVCTGAGLEAGWLPLLQRRANNPAIGEGSAGYLDLSQAITLLEPPAQIDRAAGDVHPEGNPHFHLNPENILAAGERLTERLATLDAAHAAEYRAAWHAFAERWKTSITGWKTRAAAVHGTRVVAHHVDWNYLAEWAGLEVVATLEPKPGVPPGSRHLADLLIQLEAQPASCILRTRYQPARPSEWLAKRAGVPAVELAHTVSGDAQTQSLESWFDEVLRRLVEHCQ